MNPDAVLDAAARGALPPCLPIVTGDWRLTLRAYALKPQDRDYPNHRVVGGRFDDAAETDDAGGLDDQTPLRKKLKKKAGHYGSLDRPYVVAVLCAGTFVKDADIFAALFGPTQFRYDAPTGDWVPGRARDGVWRGPRRPINTRLSAVVTLVNLAPDAVAAVEPTIWMNPWAVHPLHHPGPWRRMEIDESGVAVEYPATKTVAEVIGLPARWPHHSHGPNRLSTLR